ncbi:hypothetical protein Clacol_006902 [Clathrus columnatus]|uniref:Ubiquitin thioesterase OTU n=1 Tax=Clathrus columnatus TaxID=1419009 RepID=A0AAV5AJ04_9AGAM|nr:hypothetical protein Clacol_006902 [Clathrus columnatus]
MSVVRLRHPKGVSTIQINLNSDDQKVLDLQQAIFAATGIPPSLQDLKAGYPPTSLTLIPELPVTALGITKGDQLIVTEISGRQTTQSPPRSFGGQTTAVGVNPPNASINQTLLGRQALGNDYVQTEGGVLIHRVVPDDNSCLFSSIGVVFEQDMSAAPRLRQLAAQVTHYSPLKVEVAISCLALSFFSRPPEEYIQTILQPNSWGGAIELAIFADHYRAEISSVDIETGRIDRFGEGSNYSNRAILLYSGIHYDATSLAPTPGAPPDFHETVFPVSNRAILDAASELASRLRSQKKYTNTATFLLKCEVCGKGLKGEKEAREHASETSHVQFGEYS